MTKLLICGTRNKKPTYYDLDQSLQYFTDIPREELEIIEGCCPNSADETAEEYAKDNNTRIHHYPSTTKNYLKRNTEMIKECDRVLAFWDGFSYGTAHTIAQAVLHKKPVVIVKV